MLVCQFRNTHTTRARTRKRTKNCPNFRRLSAALCLSYVRVRGGVTHTQMHTHRDTLASIQVVGSWGRNGFCVCVFVCVCVRVWVWVCLFLSERAGENMYFLINFDLNSRFVHVQPCDCTTSSPFHAHSCCFFLSSSFFCHTLMHARSFAKFPSVLL